MDCFRVNILGCGSAKPTLRHNPTCQIVNFRGNLFMVDCGEGVQTALCKQRIAVGRIGHILLSHLHGDHCLGLTGLISSLGLGQRTGEIMIHCHPDGQDIFSRNLDFFCPDRSMEVIFAPFTTKRSEIIYEDHALCIRTIPLNHRVPTCGFLFEEKPRERHLCIEQAQAHQVPVAYYKLIKAGQDWTAPDGTVIPNSVLTTPPTPSKKYAFCSDTIYDEQIVPYIEGVDLLYHEATYQHIDKAKALQRGHATAHQAAQIAQLAHVKQLVIGHFSAQFLTAAQEQQLLDEAQAVFPNTILANEGLVLDV